MGKFYNLKKMFHWQNLDAKSRPCHLSLMDLIYLLKANNGNTRTRCEISSKLTKKTPEKRHFVYISGQVSIGQHRCI